MLVTGYFGGSNQADLYKFQIGEAMANGGVPVLHATLANTDGLRLPTTTDGEDTIGLLKERVPTRYTAQQSDRDPQALGTVDCSPNAIIQARFCGGATSGTDLTRFVNTTADATGLLLTFAASQAAYDDGYAIGATGANAGAYRKVIALTTTGTPIVAFRYDIAADDEFYLLVVGPGEYQEAQFTSDFTEVDATGDNTSNLTMRCLRLQPRAKAQGGDAEQYGYFYFSEHAIGGASI